MDIPRIFNITESAHRIHNPITPEKLATLGAALRLEPGARVLDLGSGSGEMLCTWARDHGVTGTIALLARSLRPGGVILIGEPYWRQLPPTEDVAQGCLAGAISDFLMLPELLASFRRLGYDVVEMVLADQDGWDRYEAAKWLTMRRWLEANPEDELAREVRARLSSEPERYAAYTREYVGWGVFALMAR
jgi:SAM-dependent methyltransferase